MFRMLCLIAGLVLAAAAARASPYWIRYDAENNQFPEQTGWERVILPPPAERWFEDGALVIDSRTGGAYTEDYYRWNFPEGGLNPGPGETFVMRWRVKVDEVIGDVDPYVGVISDDLWRVGFVFGYDRLIGLAEPNVSIPFAPGVFHTYELRSTDMRHYGLWIDDHNVWVGLFRDHVAFPPARVEWGDAHQGGGSLSRWQFFEFGVVPEPSSAFVLLAVMLIRGLRGACRANSLR